MGRRERRKRAGVCHLSCNLPSPERRLEGKRARNTYTNAMHSFLIEEITFPGILGSVTYSNRKQLVVVWG